MSSSAGQGAGASRITRDAYSWATACPPGSYPYITPCVLRILKRFQIRRVCDVGSGNGALAATLDEAGYHVVGVDPDEDGVALSTRQYPNISFYALAVEDDPSPMVQNEGSLFDAVVSTEVVEHLYSPHLLPIFARKLVPPGGLFIISTPYQGYLKNLLRSAANRWDAHLNPLWHHGHIKFWSRKTLTILLESNGFEVVEFHGAGNRPKWLWRWMILVARAR